MCKIIEYIVAIVRGAINGQYYCQLLGGIVSMAAARARPSRRAVPTLPTLRGA